MIRLAVDCRELKDDLYTGIGRYLVEVLLAASRAGWECLVYGNRATRLPATLSGITLHALQAGWTAWWDQVRLPRRLAQDRISVFLSPYYKGPLFSPCPTVLTIHDLLFIGYPGARRPWFDVGMTALAGLYARRATAIITDSEYWKRSIVDQLGVTPAKVRVIPIAPAPAFLPTPTPESLLAKYRLRSPYILSVGNFMPHKNLPRLLQAYAHLDQRIRRTFELVLAGGDRRNRPALEHLAGALGITDRVRFPGLIEDEDLPALYSGAALFVCPSLVEGFGLPALEAMRCGAPVAASNRASIPEVVGEAAVLFDPEDVSSMARAMSELLTEAGKGEEFSRRGLVRASAFSPERTTFQVLALLREVARVEPIPDAGLSAWSPYDG